MPNVHLIFPAAGIGKRFGSSQPKQYADIAGKTVMEWTLDVFSNGDAFNSRVLALQEHDAIGHRIAERYANLNVCRGGEERADSVLNALQFLGLREDPEDWVLVHDIARPCIRMSDVDKLIEFCRQQNSGAVLARPITDTVKQVTDDHGGCKTIDRSLLWTVQTPQCFKLGELKDALLFCRQENRVVTDEASAIEAVNGRVHLVEGSADNIKLTHADDVFLVDHYLALQERK